jgi:integrase
LAATTANHRVTVAGLFHQWGERSGSMPSRLGSWLLEAGRQNQTPDLRRYGRSIKRLGIAPAVVRRLPRLLSREEVSRLFLVAPMPYRLMFRWSLATGMRRFEVCGLRLDQLPGADDIGRADEGLLSIDLLRKGSRLCTVYAPIALAEETNWYALIDRPQSQAAEVFVNSRGKAVSRHQLTTVFRRCADQIGSKATLHHLRHTFAVHVLRVLEGYDRRGDAMNSLKTLQVLLGHASIETTEIYLRAVEVSGEPVVQALDFLYGETVA